MNASGASRAATRAAERSVELKKKLREKVQNGSIVVDHVDAYQGFWLTKETVADTNDRSIGVDGCVANSLMIFALFACGLLNLKNFVSVVRGWCGSILEEVRRGRSDTFVSPEPTFEALRRRGLMPSETQARLGTAATITYGGAFDEAYLSVIISTLSPGNGVILILNEHSVIFIQDGPYYSLFESRFVDGMSRPGGGGFRITVSTPEDAKFLIEAYAACRLFFESNAEGVTFGADVWPRSLDPRHDRRTALSTQCIIGPRHVDRDLAVLKWGAYASRSNMSQNVWNGGLSLASSQGDLSYGPGGQPAAGSGSGSAEAILTTEPSLDSATRGLGGQPTPGSGSAEAVSTTPPSLESATGGSGAQPTPGSPEPATGGSNGQSTAGSGSAEGISTTQPSLDAATRGSGGQLTLESATGGSGAQPTAGSPGPVTGGSDGQSTAGSGSPETVSATAAEPSSPATSERRSREHDLSDSADDRVPDQSHKCFTRKLAINVNNETRMVVLSYHNYGDSTGFMPILASQTYDGDELPKTTVRSLASSLEQCSPLLSRLALRGGHGVLSRVQHFVAAATAALKMDLEFLSSVCLHHGFEIPLVLLALCLPGENFSTVFEGLDGVFAQVLNDAGKSDHAYVSLASTVLRSNTSALKGENCYKNAKRASAFFKHQLSKIERTVKKLASDFGCLWTMALRVEAAALTIKSCHADSDVFGVSAIQSSIAALTSSLGANSPSRLLRHLLQSRALLSVTAMSEFLSVFGPDALPPVLEIFRKLTRAHRRDSSPFTQDEKEELARKLFCGVVETGDESPPKSKRARRLCDPPGDFGHADDNLEEPAEVAAAPGNTSPATLDSLRPPPSRSVISRIVTLPDLAYSTFVESSVNHGVCVFATPTGARLVAARIMLPRYDQTHLKRLHLKPACVDLVSADATVSITCNCSVAKLAMAFSSAAPLPCIKNGSCWHVAALSIPEVRQHFFENAVATCNAATGKPDGDIVCVVSAQRSVEHASSSAEPSRMHVYCHVSEKQGTPGNLRPAVLTLTWVDGMFHASCDACSRMRKGGSVAADCGHFKKLQDAAAHPTSAHHKIIASFLQRKQEERDRASVYDTKNQRWAFPSLDATLIKRREELTGSQVPRLRRMPKNTNPLCMGGHGDPCHMRLIVLYEVKTSTAHDATVPLLKHGVVSLQCRGCPGSTLTLQNESQLTHLCANCGGSQPNNYIHCSMCASTICSACYSTFTVASSVLFYEAFPEFAHIQQTGGTLRYYADLVEKDAMGPTLPVTLDLKPPIPPHLRKDAAEAASQDAQESPQRDMQTDDAAVTSPDLAQRSRCVYEADSYILDRESTVYGLSYSTKATIWSAQCSTHRDHRLPFIGQDRSMYIHSPEVIFKVELFEFFWYMLRTNKGTSSASFTEYIQRTYERNGAKSFVSAVTFRAAFFGYASLLDIAFNKPCPACPINRDPRTGVLYSACPIVGYDAVTLRCKTGGVGFSDAAPDAPVVDCGNVRIYDRLFFSGSAKNSESGRLRTQVAKLCSCVLDDYKSKQPEAFSGLPLQLESFENLKPYAPIVELLCSSLVARSGSKMLENAATFLSMMANEQGEILQITNSSEITFLDDVLRRHEAGNGLSHLYCREKQWFDVRRSLVELVDSALRCVSMDDAACPASFVLDDSVASMLYGIHIAAEVAFAKARKHVIPPPIPEELRQPADPSRTGCAINFTHTGQKLREWPTFINVASEAGGNRVKGNSRCRKPQHFLTRHKKFMNKTAGLFNLVCLVSNVGMGQIIMGSPEGRSLGISTMYSYLPHRKRLIDCDIGCQAASFGHTRVPRFFFKWRWLVDHFHHGKGKRGHKCALVTSPDEFATMDGKNDSFVEQLHAVQRFLGLTMQSTSLPRAMFLCQLVNDDVYNLQADKACVPEERRRWPEDPSSVQFDSDTEDEADKSGDMGEDGDIDAMGEAQQNPGGNGTSTEPELSGGGDNDNGDDDDYDDDDSGDEEEMEEGDVDDSDGGDEFEEV